MRLFAIAVLERTGRLEHYFEIRRACRARVRAVRGWVSRRALAHRVDSASQLVASASGKVIVADVEPRFTAHERMIDNVSIVAEALSSAQIEFALCPNESAQRFRVGVDEADRQAAWTALALSVARPSVYLAYTPDSARRHLNALCALGSTMPTTAATSVRWYCFRAVTDESGGGAIGLEHACELEFWTGQSIRADVGVRTAGEDVGVPVEAVRCMPATDRAPAEVTVGGRQFPSWGPFAQVFSSQQQRFPIDVVYTWVDDSDPAWLARRSARLDRGLQVSWDGASASRFTNRDELRYSLRSLEAYADFVRHVYIVTDDQRPAWLADTNDLTIVDHREIFDEDAALPTFNSHAIESRLHHIDGLSEHYVYLNDDVFFGRRVTAASFFEPSGISKFFLSKATIPFGPPMPNEPSVTSAAKNGQHLLFQTHGYAPTHKMKHTPHPQRRSILFEMEKLFSDQFKRLQQHRFRTSDDLSIASSLHHHFGRITGRAVPASISYQYVNLAANNLPDRLGDLTSGRWDTFCLNDAEVPSSRVDTVNRIVSEWLPRAFPFPSRFER